MATLTDIGQALILCFGAGGQCRSALIHRDPHLGLTWVPRTQLFEAYGWGSTETGYPLCAACVAEAVTP